MTAWFLLPLLLSGATAYNATFDRATGAHLAGDRATAIHLYERLVSEGVVNAVVFYNLGNAYAEEGRLGPAIANYERALAQAPTFENARANLAQCIWKTKRHLARPTSAAWHDRLLPWEGSLSPGTARALALSFWMGLWLFLGARLLAPLRYLRRAAVLSGLLALGFGYTAWVQMHPPLFAVVSRDALQARAAPGHDASVRHLLHEGDRVLVERRDGGWAHISTANSEEGWVPAEGLTLVGPPYEPPPDDNPNDSEKSV